MSTIVNWDFIDDTSFAADSAEAATAVAEQFCALAADPATEYDDETSPAALFVAAAEAFQDAQLPARAVEAAEAAQHATGDAAPDKRLYLFDALLQNDQIAEAHQIAAQFHAEHHLDPMVYLFIGDSYDSAGLSVEALAWLNDGVSMMDRLIQDAGDLLPEELAHVLEDRELILLERLRIRKEQGAQADKLDDEAEAILAEHEDDEAL